MTSALILAITGCAEVIPYNSLNKFALYRFFIILQQMIFFVYLDKL